MGANGAWHVEQVTYKRLKDAVQSLGNMSQQGPAAGLVDVLFGQRPPRFMANLPPWTPLNTGFDPSLLFSVSDVPTLTGSLEYMVVPNHALKRSNHFGQPDQTSCFEYESCQ